MKTVCGSKGREREREGCLGDIHCGVANILDTLAEVAHDLACVAQGIHVDGLAEGTSLIAETRIWKGEIRDSYGLLRSINTHGRDDYVVSLYSGRRWAVPLIAAIPVRHTCTSYIHAHTHT
jgi:hypothetical protein